MAFFIQLLTCWCLLWLISRFAFRHALASHAVKGRIAFSLSFIIIGLLHLLKPDSLLYMLDGWLPYALFWMYATGVLEILLAMMLLIQKTQQLAAWLIIGYLAAVFPANVYVALHQLPPPGGLPPHAWYVWSRLLFQPLYMLWVYRAALGEKHSTYQQQVTVS